MKVGLFNGALVAIAFKTVEEKFSLLPNACASSFKVFCASGALFNRYAHSAGPGIVRNTHNQLMVSVAGAL